MIQGYLATVVTRFEDGKMVHIVKRCADGRYYYTTERHGEEVWTTSLNDAAAHATNQDACKRVSELGLVYVPMTPWVIVNSFLSSSSRRDGKNVVENRLAENADELKTIAEEMRTKAKYLSFQVESGEIFHFEFIAKNLLQT